MGVDSKLFVSNSWSVEDIKDVIESQLDVKVEINSTHTPEYCLFTFPSSVNNNEKRSMSVHIDTEYHGFKGKLLTLRYNDEAVNIFKKIGEILGGFFCEQDWNDNYQGFSSKLSTSNDIYFWLKHSIKHGKLKGDALKNAETLLEIVKKKEFVK